MGRAKRLSLLSIYKNWRCITIKYYGKYLDPKDLVPREFVEAQSAIKANGTAIAKDSSGATNLVFNTAYNASTNKIATMADIQNAITAAISGSY